MGKVKIVKLGSRLYELTLEENGSLIEYSKDDLKLIEKSLSQKIPLYYEKNTGLSLEVITENRNFVEESQTGTKGIKEQAEEVFKKKPENIIVSKSNYEYLVRNILKEKSTLMIGATGTAKTTIAYSIAETLNRPFFKFPMNASSDAKNMLIGSMVYTPEKGTYFKPSKFVEAIKTPNAIILLDEYSRCHVDAENILYSVLDGQRYLSIDEGEYKEEVKVAEGVCFIATANIGNTYTATRVLDKATLNRFLLLELQYISMEEEVTLMQVKYPNVNIGAIKNICKVASLTRDNFIKEEMEDCLSTRTVGEMVEMVEDGFSAKEALEKIGIPMFCGGDSEDRNQYEILVNSLVGDSGGGGSRRGNLSPDSIFRK